MKRRHMKEFGWATYTTQEDRLCRTIAQSNSETKHNELAWIHGLKAVFDAEPDWGTWRHVHEPPAHPSQMTLEAEAHVGEQAQKQEASQWPALH